MNFGGLSRKKDAKRESNHLGLDERLRKGYATRAMLGAFGGNETTRCGACRDHLQQLDQRLREGQAAKAVLGACGSNHIAIFLN